MTEFPDTKSLLLQNIQSFDDREAWDEFVAIYRPAIYRMARRRGMQDVNAETWQAFELTIIEGLDCEQAAQRMSKSIGTIYAARSRVLNLPASDRWGFLA